MNCTANCKDITPSVCGFSLREIPARTIFAIIPPSATSNAVCIVFHREVRAMVANRIGEFRQRLRNREHLIGTFIKTPTTHTTEIIGSLGFDFIVIDQEHAPFDRTTIDLLALAARATGVTALVRVAEGTPANILSALDCGAMGVLVPHVDTARKARDVAAACRYRNGTRGFSNTTRAGRFGGATFHRHMDNQDAEVSCIAMIEDMAALDEIDEIARVDGIDAFFIGRGDLTAALNAPSPEVPQVRAIVDRIAAAARTVGMPLIVLPSHKDDALAMNKIGASAFIVSNDQSLLKSAAAQALEDYSAPLG
jgi:2-keto-3-deoxy-L-rhamnonate aldolase RhmA